jgi:hypothetical protein
MRNWIPAIILLIFLAACAPANSASITETLPPSPSVSPTVTATHLPTETTTPTAAPTITPSPLPTLGSEEAISFTLNLLEDNNDCEFPCWWGIVPGESSWEETERFLRPFVLSIRKTDQTETEQTHLVVIPVSEIIRSDGWFDFVINVKISNNEFVVDQIVIIEGYQSEIPTVLLKYGEPDQIWFWTNGPSIHNDGHLILFYQDRGMMFTYSGEVTLRGNDSNEFYFEVCSNIIGRLEPQIKLWSRSESKDFYLIVNELIERLEMLGHSEIRQLEQISNISVHEFYTAIVNGAATVDFCFQSDVEYWDR